MVDVFSLFQRDERISSPPHSHASDYLFHQFSPDESARDHGLVDHDRSVVVFEAACDKNVFFGERYVGEREREKERKTKFETHYSFGYTKHKGNIIIVPERVIGKHQNNPEKRPVFHAERRNEEGEEHGEEGGVHRWNAASVPPYAVVVVVVVVVVETRRLSVFLSLALLLCARRMRILCKAKLNTFFN